MSNHKFDVGDVVRLNHGSFKENDGTLATVKSVRQTDGSPYDVLKLETVGGWRLEVLEYMVVGVSFDVGDVVRIIGDESGRHNGELAEVIAVVQVEWSFDDVLEIRTFSGLCARVPKKLVRPVTLEEVQEHYADKPRRGFIVDGLTVDELESGQDEAYQTFRTAANEANREELRREAEEDRKEGKVLTELIATVILWAVLTIVSLVMWVIVMDRTGEMLFTLIGLVSEYAGFFLMAKPVGALIAVCRERCKALRERRKKVTAGRIRITWDK